MTTFVREISDGAGAKAESLSVAFIIAVVLAAAMGGMMFGWDWVVIGGAKPFFERFFDISSNPTLSGWANSCALLGCFVGAAVGGPISDRYGRKRPLIAAALIFAVTSVGNALAQSFTGFVAWRLAGGVAIGLASGLSPLYIAEIAPARMRGRLVALNQLTIVIGVLGAQLVNWWIVRDLPANSTDEFIASSWYGHSAWRWMFGVLLIPSALFLVGMLMVPESPRWLIKNGRIGEAKRILARIGGADYAESAASDIQASGLLSAAKVRISELFAPGVKRALLIGVVIAIFQQWCGINVIFNYAEEIFRAAGFDISNVVSNIAWTGSVNLVFTIVALNLVDSVGRKPLMLIGAAGLAAIYTAVGVCFALGVTGFPVLLLVLAAIGCYGMTLAPVTWIVISEIFPTRLRGAAMSIAVGALWLACFALTYTFPLLNAKLGAAGVFYLYAIVCVSGLLFIWKFLGETKGKTLEQLERDLGAGQSD